MSVPADTRDAFISALAKKLGGPPKCKKHNKKHLCFESASDLHPLLDWNIQINIKNISIPKAWIILTFRSDVDTERDTRKATVAETETVRRKITEIADSLTRDSLDQKILSRLVTDKPANSKLPRAILHFEYEWWDLPNKRVVPNIMKKMLGDYQKIKRAFLKHKNELQ